MYVHMMGDEFAKWTFNEEQAPLMRGRWREEAFKVSCDVPVDLEIGTGNGYYFAHHAQKYPERCLIGIELKYKPLVQSIRRALRSGSKNARIIRYDACAPQELFVSGEINNVIIHFPDPWEKKRHWKNRLVTTEFLDLLFDLQKSGSFVEFKTDSLDYFEWSLPQIEKSQYRIVRCTKDLHKSEWRDQNYVTQFESLFLRQGLQINYILLEHP